MKKSRHQEGGFTLIEILVVILIIGILAAISVPVFINQKRTANEVALQSDVNMMAKAVQGYYSGQDASKLTKVIPANPDNNGWALLLRHEQTAPGFSGDPEKNKTYNVMPENFPAVSLSPGVALGVKDFGNDQRKPGDYCIVANADNSRFESSASGTGQEQWKSSLFFDSKMGKIIDSRSDLDANGACAEYKP